MSETMLFLLAVVLLISCTALIAWLFNRSSVLRDDVRAVERRLRLIEDDLRRLSKASASGAAETAARMADTPAEVKPARSAIEILRTLPPRPAPPPLPQPPPPEREPSAEPPSSVPPIRPLLAPVFNWEQFMGVKLFAWLGGVVLFLGTAFFVKYSFERGLISPQMRVALGFVMGVGLVFGGVRFARIQAQIVTGQTLCATGIVVLYLVSFGAHSFYGLIGIVPAFVLMALVTAVAFLLAIRLAAPVVALLGLVAGFLTPFLLRTSHPQSAGLFMYLTMLDVGLIALALRQRWHWLVPIGAAGTVLIQTQWFGRFFRADGMWPALGILVGFAALFAGADRARRRQRQSSQLFTAGALAVPLVGFAFLFYALSYAPVGTRPLAWLLSVLGLDLCVLSMVWRDKTLGALNSLMGGIVFLALGAWTIGYIRLDLLMFGLAAYFVFAALHSFFPLLLEKVDPTLPRRWWTGLFPALGLVLMLIPILRVDSLAWLIWPAVLVLDLIAIGIGLVTATIASVVAAVILSGILAVAWVLRAPVEPHIWPVYLMIVGSFAVLFFAAGIYAAVRAGRIGAGQGITTQLGRFWMERVSALSIVLPFFLLVVAVGHLPLGNPSPVFGLALLLVVLLLGLARYARLDAVVPLALISVFSLEQVWHRSQFAVNPGWVPLVWYLLFGAIFFVFPFAMQAAPARRGLWITAAVAPMLHFYPVYKGVALAYPNPYMGLLPAAFAVPLLVAVAALARRLPSSVGERNGLLAWFGGSALFFLTLVFPIQFEREWITIGWAFEGAALLWLFQRVPHPGLQWTGAALLGIAFARLALNPAVLAYHARSSVRIFNWYLYGYGLVALALFAAAWWTAPPRDKLRGMRMPPVFLGLGTALLFLLLNIEIADFFSTGTALTFQFSGNFARDMTYSIAWALFGFILLVIGIQKRWAGPRWACLGLLGATLLKLFFHDLQHLAQLYRIGAFMAVAVVLILASILYQRYVASETNKQVAP